MPLADLLKAIDVEADEEITRLDLESRVEAEQMLERARLEARALERELASASERPALAEAERLRALARLDAAATLRSAREEAFAAAHAAVTHQLSEMRGSDRYPDLLRALFDESRAALPTAVRLRVDPRDLELARKLAGSLRIETVLTTWGGIELASEDGRAVRNTLEHRLENAEQVLRQRFASIPALAQAGAMVPR